MEWVFPRERVVWVGRRCARRMCASNSVDCHDVCLLRVSYQMMHRTRWLPNKMMAHLWTHAYGLQWCYWIPRSAIRLRGMIERQSRARTNTNAASLLLKRLFRCRPLLILAFGSNLWYHHNLATLQWSVNIGKILRRLLKLNLVMSRVDKDAWLQKPLFVTYLFDFT
jgi:hypothetical protein